VEVAEGVLLVMGMDAAPYQAQGPEAFELLTNAVAIAMNTANSVQWFMIARSVLHDPRTIMLSH
jgi:hypothetical protein